MPIVYNNEPIPTLEQQNAGQADSLRSQGAKVVDGAHPDHRVSDKVHFGGPSPFSRGFEPGTAPERDPQVVAHGLSVLESSK